METNVGEADRIARIGAGAVAGGLSLAILAGIVELGGSIAAVLGIVAVVMFFTAATRSCGAYSLLGMDTCKREI
ncbi:YgaP family membrane protein [Natronocalculus amylovorans]|uniref:DUF2892 domain-containing protein n=1 Tax=Natronocalculus amylovorans TaxID=2917812 RepID=A0AAE3FZ24_9EURY|nr:DUF2892 domain-containing protein [Natronocalculus amylovorans]MCL9818033.1 DUF2892 domain-containing protein [Natronocalculus amylovorans]NUE03973.1 DUF2892 domain-containing protein [Halorubraceae archaeon YAN]